MSSDVDAPTSAPGYRLGLKISKYHWEARKQGEEGNFALALEMHIWFHNNCLKFEPALSGVRLSYALGHWIELGSVYPQALEALQKIRDEKTHLLLNGHADKSLFQDVRAINRDLNEIELSTNLFKKIEEVNPALAEDCWWMIKDAFFELQDIDTINRFCPDLSEEIDQVLRVLSQHREMMIQKKKEFDESDEAKKGDQQFRKFFSESHLEFIEFEIQEFVAKAKLLVSICKKMGKEKSAREIRDKVLTIIDLDEIRNLI